jgi:hypothetical protein
LAVDVFITWLFTCEIKINMLLAISQQSACYKQARSINNVVNRLYDV